MKKSAPSISVRRSLAKFGEDLRFARLRRGLPMTLVAQRAKISLSTLRKIENGNPGVSLGNYAAVMFALNLGTPFSDLVAPSKDEVGLQLDLENVPKRARKRVTVRVRVTSE